MLSWSSVQFGPKDEQGFCDAKLTLVVRAGQPHNCIEEINSDVVVVSIGEPNKRGRGNRELSGFLRTLLGLAEDQVRLEDNVSSKSKTLLLKRLTCDKRSLIWQLQAKVGDKQPPRFATEEANAALRLADPAAKRLKDETGEYRRLQEEARAEALSALVAAPSPYSDKVSSSERPTLPQVLRVRRPGSRQEDGDQAQTVHIRKWDVEPDEPVVNVGSTAEDAEGQGSPSPEERGLQGLSQYASDESSEEEIDSDDEREVV
ncbi:GIP [Symbiodinium microadriaticum]|nr:GIP [Symbiodinium microadriaticum]